MASTIVKRLILLASLVVSFAFASQASAQRVILVDESNEATPQVEARAALGLLGISTDAANFTYAPTTGDFVTGYGPPGESRNSWALMIVELHRSPITSVTANIILDHLAAGRPIIFSAPSLYQPSSSSLFAVSQSVVSRGLALVDTDNSTGVLACARPRPELSTTLPCQRQPRRTLCLPLL